MRWLLPLVWAGVICYLSLMPGGDLPDFDLFHLLFIDKWVHVFLYFMFSLFLLQAWGRENSFILKSTSVLIFCTVFGFVIEELQENYTTTRHFEWLDLFFDSIGAGVYIFIWLRRSSKDFLKKS